MTAEVAILNKQAVAMAADSAVTIGDLKIFNTVNKLFALSKFQPVGIMVYSSAEIMGVPVETVVKHYRKSLGNQSFPTFQEYCNGFEEFLRDDLDIFPEAIRISGLANSSWKVMQSIAECANACLSEILGSQPRWGHPTKNEAKAALSNGIAILENLITGSNPIPITTRVRREVANAINASIDEGIDWISYVFPVTNETKNRIRKLVLDQLCKETQLGGETGIVMAGFGVAEVFPGLRNFEFQCSALGLHNCQHRGNVNISVQDTARIVPFAQSDVMTLFVQGRDRNLDSFLVNFLDTFLDDASAQFRSLVPPDPHSAIVLENIKQDLLMELKNNLQAFAQDNFVNPTMEIVASMPKEELAVLAEALVNLTGLKRKASRDKETVGGPTDVAIISKGDGFIWISRKHYFDQSLNPGFSSQYMEQ